MRDISILGSTGSIGVQALEVIAANPTQFRVVALAAGGSNIPLLVEQVRTFGVKVVGIEGDGALLRDALPGVNVIDGKGAAAAWPAGHGHAPCAAPQLRARGRPCA